MPTFIVHRRRGTPFEVVAHSYTEDKRAKRIFFHKRADQSDRQCFCLLSEVAAIDTRDELEPEPLEQLVARVEKSPQAKHALEVFCRTGVFPPLPTPQEEWEALLAQLPSGSDPKST